ncbi:MAG: formylglycine-generating enzyme family protein [Cyanobacteria bacterium J06642_3]
MKGLIETVSEEEDQAQHFTEDLGNGIKLEMIAIPGGKFLMGSPTGEGRNDEKPQHKVSVPPFFLGKYPITQAQYQQIMGNNPSRFQEDNRPVETVSWDDAAEFCQKLSKQTGTEYRLPTEAEWEYACRAGTSTKYYFGNYEDQLKEYAWYSQNSSNKTHPVGEKKPNQWGLFDLHGNVWEWCQDDWHGNYKDAPTNGSARVLENKNAKVIRGVSWYVNPRFCRSAIRDDDPRENRIDDIGFRIVCIAPRTT